MEKYINKKTIGNQYYFNSKSMSNFNENYKVKIVNLSEYRTNGESLILIKDTPTCKLVLDSTTTTSITIKSLTNSVITPLIGRIDEQYDEILMNNGSCVEFFNIEGNWYILSSDGLKLDN